MQADNPYSQAEDSGSSSSSKMQDFHPEYDEEEYYDEEEDYGTEVIVSPQKKQNRRSPNKPTAKLESPIK